MGGRQAEQVYFTACLYGSLYKAYQAAVAYEKTLAPIIRRGSKKPRKTPTCRNVLGIVGVCPINRRGEEMGIRAYWQEDAPGGKRKHKSKDFYYSIHGNSALRLAIRHREQKTDT